MRMIVTALTLLICSVAGGANAARQAADKARVAANALDVQGATATEAGAHTAGGAGGKARGALGGD